MLDTFTTCYIDIDTKVSRNTYCRYSYVNQLFLNFFKCPRPFDITRITHALSGKQTLRRKAEIFPLASAISKERSSHRDRKTLFGEKMISRKKRSLLGSCFIFLGKTSDLKKRKKVFAVPIK